jgi:hypothetical protein
MTEVCDFVFSLARVKKTGKEIKPLIDTVYGDNTLSISQINLIIKAMKEGKSFTDQRHSNTKKKTKRTNDVVAAFAAVEKNRCLTVSELTSMLDLTFTTFRSTFTVDLGFVKKSAHWVPKLLTMVQKDERVQ